MPTHSAVADRVLWDGEGAISSRRLLGDSRTPSTFGNTSLQGGDEWSVAYMREESLLHMNNTTGRGEVNNKKQRDRTNTNKRLWMARFRRHRIVAPKTPQRTTAQKEETKSKHITTTPTAATFQLNEHERPLNIASRAQSCPEQSASEESQLLQRYESQRTTRDHVDGKSLMVKQRAKVFNRDSTAKDHLSISDDDDDVDDDNDTVDRSITRAFQNARLVRNVSSLSMGSHHVTADHQYQRGDWGDPFGMYSLEEDDDEEDPSTSFLETAQEEVEDLQLEEYHRSAYYYGGDIDVMHESLSIASDPGSLAYEGFFDDDEPGSPNLFASVPCTQIMQHPSITFIGGSTISRNNSTGTVKRRSSTILQKKKMEERRRSQLLLSSSCEDICFVPAQHEQPDKMDTSKKSSRNMEVRAYIPPRILALSKGDDTQPQHQQAVAMNNKRNTNIITSPDRIEHRAVTMTDNIVVQERPDTFDRRSITFPIRTAGIRVPPRLKRRPIEDVDEPPSRLALSTRKITTLIVPSTTTISSRNNFNDSS